MTCLFYSMLEISVVWEILLSKHFTSQVTFAIETKNVMELILKLYSIFMNMILLATVALLSWFGIQEFCFCA